MKTRPAIIAQTIGRRYALPKLNKPEFGEALVDFTNPKIAWQYGGVKAEKGRFV